MTSRNLVAPRTKSANGTAWIEPATVGGPEGATRPPLRKVRRDRPPSVSEAGRFQPATNGRPPTVGNAGDSPAFIPVSSTITVAVARLEVCFAPAGGSPSTARPHA
jgi:hypothetical protein